MGKQLQKPLSRDQANLALIANALTKPWPNVAVPAGLAAGGLMIGLGLFVVAIAAVAWLALASVTYLDQEEADVVIGRLRATRRGLERGERRVNPDRLAAPIAQQLRDVLAQEQRIRDAIEGAELPFAEVSQEVDTFVRSAERAAARAQLLYDYVADEDRTRVELRLRQLRGTARTADSSAAALVEALTTQLQAIDRAQLKLDDFYTEMERVAVELGNIRGQLLSVSATTEAAAQRELAGGVRDLREQMAAVAEGMSEALEGADALLQPGPGSD